MAHSTHQTIIAGLLGLVAVLIGALVTLMVSYSDARSDRTDLANQVAKLQGEVSRQDAEAKTNASAYAANGKLVGQYFALVTYALQQGKLSQEEVSRFVSGFVTGATTPIEQQRTVQITDPSERSQMQDGMEVRGTVARSVPNLASATCWTPGCSNTLPASQRTLWIVTQPVGTSRFYPQGNWPEQTGRVLMNSAHEWISPPAYMGALRPESPYLIHAVMVNPAEKDVFKSYLEKGWKTKQFAGLKWSDVTSGSAQIMDTVAVVRK